MLAQGTSWHYFVLQSLHKIPFRTTLYYKAYTRHFPVLLCTAMLAQSTPRYYCVLQSLTKHFPVLLQSLHKVLLCSEMLAQGTSWHYFVLQSLHKALLSTTFYFTKLAQSTSQHYFVLQCLHRVPPGTTLYYKAWQGTSQYYFVLQSLHKALPSTTLYYKACTKYFPVHRVLLPWKSGWKNLSVYMEVVYVQFLGKKWNWATGPANAEKPTVNLLHGSSSSDMSVTYSSWKCENWD